jgi:hypothetical protein
MKSGSLSLLEPSGPVQACNGIALPLLYIKNIKIRICKLRPNKFSPVSPSRYLVDLEHQHRGLSRISHEGRQSRLSRTQFQYSKTILNKHLLKQKKNTLTIPNVRLYDLQIASKMSAHTKRICLVKTCHTSGHSPYPQQLSQQQPSACNTDWLHTTFNVYREAHFKGTSVFERRWKFWDLLGYDTAQSATQLPEFRGMILPGFLPLKWSGLVPSKCW